MVTNVLRDTYANVNQITLRIKAAASLLQIGETSLRSYIDESGIDITRASTINPKAPATRIFTVDRIFELANWRRTSGKVKKLSDRPIVITVDLIKGGVGKSTTSAEVAMMLQLMGYKVLVIDLDPSSNLTNLMCYEPDLEESEAENYGLSPKAIVKYTFDHLITPYIEHKRKRESRWLDINQIIKKPFGEYGPHLIPSDVYLDDLVDRLKSVSGDSDFVINSFFNDAFNGQIPGFSTKEYDFILMDCAPSVSAISLNAMGAADYIIAPVKMDLFAAKGISRLVSEINVLKERPSARDMHLIILPTHYSSNLNRTGRMIKNLENYRLSQASESINQSELFPSSQLLYMPVCIQWPNSEPVKQYQNFTTKLVEKIAEKFA